MPKNNIYNECLGVGTPILPLDNTWQLNHRAKVATEQRSVPSIFTENVQIIEYGKSPIIIYAGIKN